jgi:hypothetical protein
LVFDEGTESAHIATNEKILLLDEYSKVKLFSIASPQAHWRELLPSLGVRPSYVENLLKNLLLKAFQHSPTKYFLQKKILFHIDLIKMLSLISLFLHIFAI